MLRSVLVGVFILLSTFSLNAQIRFEINHSYRYLKGNKASSLVADWMFEDFEHSEWNTGNAPFRYGDGSGGIVLSDMSGVYSTFYMRSVFTVEHGEFISKINFNVNYDDGFIIWVNGKVALTSNAPDNPAYNSFATANHESGSIATFKVDADKISLVEGENCIAIQAFNVTLNSSDFYFDLSIDSESELPEYEYEISDMFSHDAGFYTEPFDLLIKSTMPDCSLLYTIDGSDPQTASDAISVQTEKLIRIDPNVTANRGKTPAFIVRVSLLKEGYRPSKSLAKTFVFIDEVIDQDYPGHNWPNGSANSQVMDYEMATDITKNSQYSGHLIEALTQIPTISISTDNKNLFDSGIGIYANAEQKGIEWERPCSAELLNPDGSEGFQINAGLRIRGGNSAKQKGNPKHGFRLFFRSEYGESKLKFPLFDDEGAGEFDAIDLRCEQNYSWNMDGSPYNNLVKDIFCRDLQREMGQPYKRGRQYHLYINGMYWGIYQTDERAEASYAETYFGGDKEDYDVVKVNSQPWPYVNEATDGNIEAWEKLWQLCSKGFSMDGQYFGIEGKTHEGKPNPDGEVLVDIDNLIDYMLVIFYSGNFDAPVSGWYGNEMPNNYYAIFNRNRNDQGFKFLAHDSEHSLFVDRVFGYSGINENRVNLGSTGQMKINSVYSFNPQWLHYKLTSNSEYRIRFANRAYAHLMNGILSPEKAKALFQSRVEEIDMAIIAESARWGDAKSRNSLSKNNHWLPAINSMYNDFFPVRTNIVIGQLQDEKLWPKGMAAEINQNGIDVSNTKIDFSGSVDVTVSNPMTSGVMYYTINGSDPRSVGGGIADGARIITSGNTIKINEFTVLKVQIKYSSYWGPVSIATFRNSNTNFDKLRVTELHYHPEDVIVGEDTVSGKDFEFIEFKNIGSSIIDLTGLSINTGITYQFPDKAQLNPQAFFVVASKPTKFESQHGFYPDGNFSQSFSNSGEFVQLVDEFGNQVIAFNYSDTHPWPEEADGSGYSLVAVELNPEGNPSDYNYWRTSSTKMGSPAADDNGSSIQFNTTAELVPTFYPNPTNGIIRLSMASNADVAHIAFFDLMGRKVAGFQLKDGQKINLNNEWIKPGIYISKIEVDNKTYTQKMIYTKK